MLPGTILESNNIRHAVFIIATGLLYKWQAELYHYGTSGHQEDDWYVSTVDENLGSFHQYRRYCRKGGEIVCDKQSAPPVSHWVGHFHVIGTESGHGLEY